MVLPYDHLGADRTPGVIQAATDEAENRNRLLACREGLAEANRWPFQHHYNILALRLERDESTSVRAPPLSPLYLFGGSDKVVRNS